MNRVAGYKRLQIVLKILEKEGIERIEGDVPDI